MAENDLNDPDKDYGLPKVEIKPLSQASGPVALPIKPQEPKTIEEAAQEKEVNPLTDVPQEQAHKKENSQEPAPQKVTPPEAEPKEVRNQEAPTKEVGNRASASKRKDEATLVSAGERKKDTGKEETKNRSFAWIWIVVVLAIGAGAWALYNNFQDQTEAEQPMKEIVEETPPASPAPPVEEEIEEPVQKIGLTEIRAREENSRFFVVVGSFNNEAMAKDFSENLHQKEMNTFLVYPYGDVSNYRLAIAHFPSFDQAMMELNRVKGDYKEDLWVLKY